MSPAFEVFEVSTLEAEPVAEPKLVVFSAQTHLKLGQVNWSALWEGVAFTSLSWPPPSPLSVSSNTPARVTDISKTALLWLQWHCAWKWLLPGPALLTASGRELKRCTAAMTSSFFPEKGLRQRKRMAQDFQTCRLHHRLMEHYCYKCDYELYFCSLIDFRLWTLHSIIWLYVFCW